MTIYQARTITVSIAREWREVYDFASIPANWPRWAHGLGRQFKKSGGEWTAENPDGHTIRIRFSQQNTCGVLDHSVFTPDGRETHNALRVVPNGAGAEVMFTILKMHGMTDEVFAVDAAAVARDLNTLKTILES